MREEVLGFLALTVCGAALLGAIGAMGWPIVASWDEAMRGLLAGLLIGATLGAGVWAWARFGK